MAETRSASEYADAEDGAVVVIGVPPKEPPPFDAAALDELAVRH